MAHQSFMRTVYEMALSIAEENNGEASCDAVSSAMLAKSRQEHKNILNVLSDLFGQGRLQRLRKGVYAPVTSTKKPEKRQVMWWLLRHRKAGVTVEDLVTMADVSSEYAKEWLRMLVVRGVVRKIQKHGKAAVWILVKDSMEMPNNEEKAAKQRALRAKKKAELVSRLSKMESEIQFVKSEISDL